MTPGRTQASRVAEVRRAAHSWARAGAIDEPVCAAIEEAYPPDKREIAPAWRVLIFVIASVAIFTAFAAFTLVARATGAASWLFFGAILGAATEALDRSSLSGNGAAGATSFWAVVTLSAGFATLAASGHSTAELEVALFAAAAAFVLACWRWGFEIYGALGAIAFFFLLARFPGARASWATAALVLLVATFRLLDRVALAPPHRAAMAGVFGIAAVALYAALNRFAMDQLLIEELRGYGVSRTQPSPTARTLAAIATVLLPLAFLAWGIRARRRLILDLGALFTLLSLATLRHYVHLGPLWAILCIAGTALLLAVLALGRKLRRSPGGEWGGFTTLPLFSGEAGALPIVAVVVAFAPDTRQPEAPDSTSLTGGGGRSGGGGAEGSF